MIEQWDILSNKNESCPTIWILKRGWVCLYTVDMMDLGAFIVLRNAKIDMYKGAMRLAVDKWGLIEAATETPDLQVKV